MSDSRVFYNIGKVAQTMGPGLDAPIAKQHLFMRKTTFCDGIFLISCY